MHCLFARGRWLVELLQCSASLHGGSRQWNSYNAAPHSLRAVGIGSAVMHYLTVWGQLAVALPQCTASLHGGSC